MDGKVKVKIEFLKDQEQNTDKLTFQNETFVPRLGEEIRINSNPTTYKVKKVIHHFCDNEYDLTLQLE